MRVEVLTLTVTCRLQPVPSSNTDNQNDGNATRSDWRRPGRICSGVPGGRLGPPGDRGRRRETARRSLPAAWVHPSKALLHVAKSIADAEHLAEWGVAFGKPAIDLEAIRKRKEKVISTLTGGLGQLAKKRNVRVIQARALSKTPRPSSSPRLGKRPSTTTGSASSMQSWPPARARPGFPRRDRLRPGDGFDRRLALADVPESLLVVGGGYIGLEMGTVYAAARQPRVDRRTAGRAAARR